MVRSERAEKLPIPPSLGWWPQWGHRYLQLCANPTTPYTPTVGTGIVSRPI